MERPRLRPLEAFPVVHEGEKLLALRDPSGVAPGVKLLHPAAVAILQMCDGETTRDEICAQYLARYRATLTRAALDQLLDDLDRFYLLDSDTFRGYSAALYADFARADVRPPYFAGRSYDDDPAALSAALDAMFTAEYGPGKPGARQGAMPRAIIAPHVDFPRGGPAYAWAYRALAEAKELPERIIIFGTNHAGARPFALTRKHYDTPLGRLQTDVAFVDALVARASERTGIAAASELFAEEHHHRGEHSIEFQAVWLRHVLGEAGAHIPIVPILCGSFHAFVEQQASPRDHRLIDAVLNALPELTADKRTLWIAGVDLAHVGPRYGDKEALTAIDMASLEKRDRETLAAVLRGSANDWMKEIEREGDARRVCGLSPIYSLLSATPLKDGEIKAYAQCVADETGGSIVSIAAITY